MLMNIHVRSEKMVVKRRVKVNGTHTWPPNLRAYSLFLFLFSNLLLRLHAFKAVVLCSVKQHESCIEEWC